MIGSPLSYCLCVFLKKNCPFYFLTSQIKDVETHRIVERNIAPIPSEMVRYLVQEGVIHIFLTVNITDQVSSF